MFDALPQPRRSLATHLIPLTLFILVAGAVNIYLGKDYSWDLRNYHYYNAWAMLKHRIDIDVLPANLQGFHNPLIELPFYLLASKRVNDFIIAFAMAIPAAVSMYILWRLTGALTSADPARRRPTFLVLRAATVIAAVTGGAGWCQWGTTSGEWPVACLALVALYLALALPPQARARLAIGPLLGLACGLKLTAIPFACAVGIAYVYVELSTATPHRWRRLAILVIGGALAFVLALAPWGWVLWKHYHNPLFPYFNGIFKSDAIEKTNWRDARFLPSGVFQWMKVPFDLAFHYEAKYGDSTVRDPRSLIGLGVLVASTILACVSARFRRGVLTRQFVAVALAFTVAFLFWLVAFAIYRYAIGVEMTACLLMFMLVSPLVRHMSASRSWTVLAIFAPLLATSVESLGRSRFDGGAYFQEQLPSIPAGSLVINYVATDPPLGYLSPMLGSHVTVVKPLSNLSRPGWNESFQDRIRDIVAHSEGRIFVIQAPPMAPETRAQLAALGLEPESIPCGSISAPFFKLADYVCEFRRTRI